jgi:hypothetical protein
MRPLPLHRLRASLFHRHTLFVRLRNEIMRNEIENIVDEIKQAVSLLRRHL